MADSFDMNIRFAGNGTLLIWSLLSFCYKQGAYCRNKNVLASPKAHYFEEQALA